MNDDPPHLCTVSRDTTWAVAVTIHGTTRELSGGLELTLAEDGTALITGQQRIDIRDFTIDLPSVLMLKIFPDVTVRFRIQAVRETQDDESRGSA